LLLQYKYWIVVPLAFFEGPVTSLIAGFMVRLGYLYLIPILILFVVGDIVPDIVYYFIGRYGNRTKIIKRYMSTSNFLSRNLSVVEKLWSDHGKKTMFFTKIAYGLSTPFLISAGLVKMPFKKFIKYELPISVIQYIVLIGIGYLLGTSFELVSTYVRGIEYITISLTAVMIIIFILVSRYARDWAVKMEVKEEEGVEEEMEKEKESFNSAEKI